MSCCGSGPKNIRRQVRPERDQKLRAILHIGFPKTGTSSIQRYCSNNYKALQKDGILFARTGRILSGKDRARHMGFHIACEPFDTAPTGIMKNYGLTSSWSRRRYSKRFFRKLDRELKVNSDAEIVVFSAEELAFQNNLEMMDKARHELTQRFDEVTVFCMVREPFDYLSSSYSQYVKMGGTDLWPAFRDQHLSNQLYFSALSRWIDVFGMASVSARVMKANALEQFEEELGRRIDIKSAKRENLSLSELGIDLLRQINENYEQSGRARPKKVRTLFTEYMVGSSWKAPLDDAAVIYEKCQPGIDAMVACGVFQPTDVVFLQSNWNVATVCEKYMRKAPQSEANKIALTKMLQHLFK